MKNLLHLIVKAHLQKGRFVGLSTEIQSKPNHENY
jgi:hypothetical protein